MNKQLFEGRKLLVVGGTSGMGLRTAHMVLQEGGSVVVVGHRAVKAEEARASLAAGGSGNRVFALTADLTSEEGVKVLLAELDRDHKDIDMLVNAAGVFFPKSFLNIPKPTTSSIRNSTKRFSLLPKGRREHGRCEPSWVDREYRFDVG